MNLRKSNQHRYSLLAMACAAAIVSSHAFAQDTTPSADKAPKKLETVTVTGSLIPQTEIETATPITTITAADIKAKGFSTVADALQQSSFATGSTQGAQSNNSFTPGAQTLSMFGLPVGYVKYLIDGRPMASFPSLYNGSETFSNLSSIPTDLVDHIDVLPGGQSSLYGSDAIAGVVNIVLKKKLDAPIVDIRYGWTSDGGGADRRASFADSFNVGKFNLLAGVQFESTQPIWTRDRALTARMNDHGTTPATASRDYLVSGSDGYDFLDPNRCALVSGQFGGTEGLRHRPNSGNYCGSFDSAGYSAIATASKSVQGYAHATFDVNENVQLYGDLLYSYQQQKMTSGSATTFWGTSLGYGAIYDPNLDDFVNLQHAFSPEEVGGYQSIMDKSIENTYMLTFGAKGTFGASDWDYDVGFTHSDDKLIERSFSRFTQPMESYFAEHVLGPNLGPDPYGQGYDTYMPNYEAFYSPLSNADFRSFTGYIDTHSKSWDNMARALFTNASLVHMPGGDAGIAVLIEGGNQGWDYSPDPRLLTGDIWGKSAVQGAGHRSRYAATTELRLPLTEKLTMDASVRYDAFNVANTTVSKPTYNVGFEFRPFETLLFRVKYGSAFKAPTLSDEFQGDSSAYSFSPDYYNCSKLGFGFGEVANCPTKYNNAQFITTQSGNPNLQPISAKVWSYGLVWAPMTRMSLTMDMLHWSIKNEIQPQDPTKILQQEALCRLGQLDAQSSTCAAVLSQVERDPLGNITSIYTPKVNVANEQINALVLGFNYGFALGDYGKIGLNTSYSNVLKHTQQQYPGDPTVDLLRSPLYSTDFKTKANASVTWSRNEWSATLYGSRFGSTPNYLATATDGYIAPGTGKLAPWMLYNASVSYTPMPKLTLSFLINNVFNKMPPIDRSYPGTVSGPYNETNYNVYGRTLYVEASYKF